MGCLPELSLGFPLSQWGPASCWVTQAASGIPPHFSEGGWGPGHCSLSLGALKPAADSASSSSSAQIWADPGKYALMGAAAQLGECLLELG